MAQSVVSESWQVNVDGIEERYATLIQRCMNADPIKRPPAADVCQSLFDWRSRLLDLAMRSHPIELPVLVLITIFDYMDELHALIDFEEKWVVCAAVKSRFLSMNRLVGIV